jgi:transcriptional regulator GlxA family with amidase domain
MQTDPRIADALLIMEKNYGDPLSASQMAKQANLSSSHFQHLFIRETRSSFKCTLINIRFQRACELLIEVDLSIKEICFAVGFSWPPNFTRQFKRRFGKTPSRFRIDSNRSKR